MELFRVALLLASVALAAAQGTGRESFSTLLVNDTNAAWRTFKIVAS
jgi:hypothetical protein